MWKHQDCRLCERQPERKKIWGCDEPTTGPQVIVRRYRQDSLEFFRCPHALLRESPQIEALALWAVNAWYHYQNRQLLDVGCDGSHLSAQGHDVLDVWIFADSQRNREEKQERDRKAKQAQAKSSRR